MRALSAQHFLPREGDDIELRPRQIHRKGSRRRVANRKAAAGLCNPIAIRNAYAGRGAVPYEDNIVFGVGLSEIGQFAIRGFDDPRIFQLQLSYDIVDPILAEALPGDYIDGSRSQQRP